MSVNKLIAGNGITINPTSGQGSVFVSNSGVTDLIAGQGIEIVGVQNRLVSSESFDQLVTSITNPPNSNLNIVQNSNGDVNISCIGNLRGDATIQNVRVTGTGLADLLCNNYEGSQIQTRLHRGVNCLISQQIRLTAGQQMQFFSANNANLDRGQGGVYLISVLNTNPTPEMPNTFQQCFIFVTNSGMVNLMGQFNIGTATAGLQINVVNTGIINVVNTTSGTIQFVLCMTSLSNAFQLNFNTFP